jgi:hypothetical protein
VDNLSFADFDSREEALAHADLMVAEMREEVGAAADRADRPHDNPLRAKFYFVRCLGKSRIVSAEETKTLAATADVKDAKTAAAAAAAMGDGTAAGSSGAGSSGDAAPLADGSGCKVENELFGKVRAAVEPLRAAIRTLGGLQSPLGIVHAKLMKKPALASHAGDLDELLQAVESTLKDSRAAVADAMAFESDEPEDRLLQAVLDRLVHCCTTSVAHIVGIYNNIYTCIHTRICIHIYMYIYIYI